MVRWLQATLVVGVKSVTRLARGASPGLLVGVIALVLAVSLSACSSGYIMRAAYEQSKILLARRPIEKVIQDPQTPPEQKEKLAVVLDARSFAASLGLNPGGSFTKYSAVDRDPLAWVLVASRRDAFALRLWWFPIVGSVPYKGFFQKEDALVEAQDLEAQGFETSVRGTEAFSTLGWFNDPVLSTTLKNSPLRIVNTVIHETVHSTVWIKDNVAFNESLAHFIGTQGALAYYQAQEDRCLAERGACSEQTASRVAAEADRAFQFELSTLVDSIVSGLERLYGDPAISSAEKIAQRAQVFDGLMNVFRQKYPKVQILKQINNAEIVQIRLYLTALTSFQRLFEHEKGDWVSFITRVREIARLIDQGVEKDPFEVVRNMVSEIR
jgi:predicted aminopeptidase